MSKDSLDKFFRFILDHPELRTQLEKTSDINAFSKIAVQLGQEHGFSFSEEDAKQIINERQNQMYELTDEQLAVVAGGKDDGGGGIASNTCGSSTRSTGGDCTPNCYDTRGHISAGNDGGNGDSGGGGLSWG